MIKWNIKTIAIKNNNKQNLIRIRKLLIIWSKCRPKWKKQMQMSNHSLGHKVEKYR